MCDSSTFLQHWCPENIVKQRFHNQNVRQFYVFATLMSGKHGKTTILRPTCATVLRFFSIDARKHGKTMISRQNCATVLRFCNTDVRKTPFFNDFTTKMCDSSMFLQHGCPENTVKQRKWKCVFRKPLRFDRFQTWKHEKPDVFLGFSNKDPVGTRDDIRQTHPNPWRPFRARVGQIYEIRRPFRARAVKIVEMNARQALTFLTVSRPKCATVPRFCNIDVRKTL